MSPQLDKLETGQPGNETNRRVFVALSFSGEEMGKREVSQRSLEWLLYGEGGIGKERH